MDICDSSHEEIVYTNRDHKCPLCLANEEIRDLEDALRQLQIDLDHAKEEVWDATHPR